MNGFLLINFLSIQAGFQANARKMALESNLYLLLIGSSKPKSVYIIAGGLREILDEFEGIIEWFVRKRFPDILTNQSSVFFQPMRIQITNIKPFIETGKIYYFLGYHLLLVTL